MLPSRNASRRTYSKLEAPGTKWKERVNAARPSGKCRTVVMLLVLQTQTRGHSRMMGMGQEDGGGDQGGGAGDMVTRPPSIVNVGLGYNNTQAS